MRTNTDGSVVVNFVEPDGRQRRVPVLNGQSLMDAALLQGVQGIVGQCGGAINCATCLIDIHQEDQSVAGLQISHLPAQPRDEIELLGWVDEATTNSRLACQLLGEAALAGLVVRVVSPAS